MADWLVPLVGNAGVGGILVWYLWYTTAKLWPKLHKQHHETLNTVVQHFREDLREERECRAKQTEQITRLVSVMERARCIADVNE